MFFNFSVHGNSGTVNRTDDYIIFHWSSQFENNIPLKIHHGAGVVGQREKWLGGVS